MGVVRCTVRGCEGELLRDGDAVLRCPHGHAFDRAREGYWNLLQPQDRKSPRAGDRDEAILARRRWLAHGHVAGLIALLSSRIDALALPSGAVALDVGCGEGTLTAQLLGGRELEAYGIDLSTRAVRLAARLDAKITWIVANADRALPFADGRISLALSIFGRRPAAELARVLAPHGTLFVVVPGDDDLIELRALSQGETLRRDRTPDVLAELAPRFTLAGTWAWTHTAHHDPEAAADALAMTYRGARGSERERLRAIEAMDVTLSAAILTLVPRGGVR